MGAKPHILIVDDDRVLDKILGTALDRAGFQVSVAYDGHQGLDKVQEARPDLIIADVMMPRMDGYEFCHHLKADARLASIPIIMFTALGDLSLLKQSCEDPTLKVDEFITKPVRIGDLLERVRALLWLDQVPASNVSAREG